MTGRAEVFARLAADERIAWIGAASTALLNGDQVYYCPGPLTIYGPLGEYVTVGEGWDGPGLNAASLSYHFDNGTPDISGTAEQQEIRNALAEWARYAQLTFTEIGNTGANRSFDILWASGAHGDGNPFDGPGSVLAHAAYPVNPNSETIAGDIHFDEDENWMLNGNIHQFSVALHEAGHSLGLGHSADPNAVMFASYRGPVSGLHSDDINGIRALYESRNSAGPNEFTIRNVGGGTLSVNSITDDRNWLSTSGYPGTPFNFAGGAAQNVTVNVDWALVGGTTQTGNVTVASNDPDEPAVVVQVTAIPLNQGIVVTSPAAGANWPVGSTQTVSWSSSNVSGNVNIKLSTNGGSSFPNSLASNTSNDGTQTVTVPNNPSTTCRVRVESVSNTSVFGDNPGNFTISPQPQTPFLSVNPLSLNFTAQQGGPNPANQTFNITNAGAGNMSWTVADDQPWLSANPSSGSTTTETDVITVEANIAGLAAGSFNGNITVTAPGAGNSPQIVRVTLTVTQVSGCNVSACSGPAIFPVPKNVTVIGTPLKGRNNDTLYVDIRLQQNGSPVDAFGFIAQVDSRQLRFVAAEKGDLTRNFIDVRGLESPANSGTIVCGGFGTNAIPVNSAGVLIRLCFVIQCSAGDASDFFLRSPTDDLANVSTCCNMFSCATCVSDGDVNGDLALTPGDAQCSFQIFLNRGALPADCDVPNFECEVTAADVNCDRTVTPGDAQAIFTRFLNRGAPLECFARTVLAEGRSGHGPYQLSWNVRTLVGAAEGDLVKVSLVLDNPAGLHAFGLQLNYPASRVTLLGVQRASLTREWIQLEGQAQANGALLIGGFHDQPISGAAPGELLQVLFSAKNANISAADFSLSHLVDDFGAALLKGAGAEATAAMPSSFQLHQSFPNPFAAGKGTRETVIRFDLPGAEAVPVELTVYNLTGQLVRRVLTGARTPGAYEVSWEGKNEHGQLVPSGTYLYRLKAGNWTASRYLTVVR